MPEISAFTASLGHNGLMDVFAIGAPGDDHNGTAVFLSLGADCHDGDYLPSRLLARHLR